MVDSTAFAHDLRQQGELRDAAIAALHALLIRVARAEAGRRRPLLPPQMWDELDDLCIQSASDAVMGVLRKLGDFRGQSRFTTWACKFVIFELSTRLRRHAWRHRAAGTDSPIWDTLSGHGRSPLGEVEDDELQAVVHRAIRARLTERQRTIFQAAVIDEVPIDVLAEQMQSSRGAIYKTVHDARRKLRDALRAAGYEESLP